MSGKGSVAVEGIYARTVKECCYALWSPYQADLDRDGALATCDAMPYDVSIEPLALSTANHPASRLLSSPTHLYYSLIT